MANRRKTTTSNFGVGARESHDATPFYDRFRAPDISQDETVFVPFEVSEPFLCGDSRNMHQIPSGSVALVVTSPPYFAGKQYEEELEREGVPSSYLEYLEMLTAVFAECLRTLEPGGRIAVNVANLGRKPYRSLSADVIRILEHDLGMLLRGELIWQKGEGASGSCAWGSFRSATNPVLRDISERVIIASKGRFDRARNIKRRAAEGLPHTNTIYTDDFMALTLDIWNIAPESARRVGHPAPFPVELPEKLIKLYTFENDLVLDPFMGSGSSLIAAARVRRRYVGYDLDPAYVDIARERLRSALETQPTVTTMGTSDASSFVQRAISEGKAAHRLAEGLLHDVGFANIKERQRIPKTGVTVNFTAIDGDGQVWYFDVAGAFSQHRGGLLRTDAVWKALGRASTLKRHLDQAKIPLILLTSHLPRNPSEGNTALREAGPNAFFDAIEMIDLKSIERLRGYAKGSNAETPELGYWTPADLERRTDSLTTR